MTFTYQTSSLGSPPEDTRLILAMRPPNAKAGDLNLRSTPGLQAVTGLGFQPTCVMVCMTGRQNYGGGAEPGKMQFGVQTLDDAWSWSASSGNIVPKWRNCALIPDYLIGLVYNTTAQYRALAYVDSFDADGFTLNVEEQNIGTTAKVIWVAFDGEHRCGIFDGSTSTGQQAISGVGIEPTGLMLVSGKKLNHVISDGWDWCVGYGDDRLEQGAYWAGARPLAQDVWFPRSHSYWAEGSVISMEYPATGPNHAGAHVLARARLLSCDADGFTLDWTAADGNGYKVGYFATAELAEMLNLLVPDSDITTGPIEQLSRFCPKVMVGNGMNYGCAGNPSAYVFGGQASISLAGGDPWTTTFDEEGGVHMAEGNVTTVGYIQESDSSIDSVNFAGMGSGSFQTHKLNITECAPPIVGMNWRYAQRHGVATRALTNVSDDRV